MDERKEGSAVVKSECGSSTKAAGVSDWSSTQLQLRHGCHEKLVCGGRLVAMEGMASAWCSFYRAKVLYIGLHVVEGHCLD